jgi:hypothetical protein
METPIPGATVLSKLLNGLRSKTIWGWRRAITGGDGVFAETVAVALKEEWFSAGIGGGLNQQKYSVPSCTL